MNKLSAEDYFKKALKNIEKEDFKHSLYYLNKVIKLNPKYAKAYIHRAYIKEQNFNIKASISDLTRAIILNKNAEIFLKRGKLFLSLKEYKKAIRDFSSAIKLKPKYAQAYLNRGWTYNILMKKKEAKHDFNKAAELDYLFIKLNNENNADKNYSIDKTRKNVYCYYLKKDDSYFYDKAEREFFYKDYIGCIYFLNYFLNSNPKYFNGYHLRGLAKLELKKYKEAILDFDYAIKLNPIKATYYTNRGLANYLDKNFKDAYLDWKKAEELNDEDAIKYLKKYF